MRAWPRSAWFSLKLRVRRWRSFEYPGAGRFSYRNACSELVQPLSRYSGKRPDFLVKTALTGGAGDSRLWRHEETGTPQGPCKSSRDGGVGGLNRASATYKT